MNTSTDGLCFPDPPPHAGQEDSRTGDIALVGALAGGALAASLALWYYSRRYVGEVALLPGQPPAVRFSVLDFWGNREVRGRSWN